MGILARLETERRYRAAAQQGATTYTAQSPEFIKWLSGASSSGKAVNEDTILGVSAAWSCQRILSEVIGSIPWSMYRRDKLGNAEKADDFYLQDVLVGSPNRDQTSVEFRETEVLNLCGDGNAYSFIDRFGKRITSLMPLRSRDVTPTRKLGTNTKLALQDGEVFFRVADRGAYEDYPREKIWQVKGFGRDPLRGLSPIKAAREAAGGALAMEEFANRFFSQGGMPAGTVTYPGWLKPEQRQSARESLNMMIGGLGKAHQFALFEGGVKPEPWNTMNLEDMQFLMSRDFSVLEVCRFYRVPPHMVAKLDKGASYASIEQMSQEFVMFTLLPYFTRFEASVAKWLLTEAERRTYFLKFNFEGLLRAASKERSEFYSSAVQNGWMSRNQVRAKEDMNRSDAPGMDDFTVQTNLTPIDKLGETPLAAQPAPNDPTEQPAAGRGAEVTVKSDIHLPDSLLQHEVEHKFPAITDLVGAVLAGQRDLANAMRRMADALANGQARVVENLLDGYSTIAAKITGGHEQLARAITDGNERLGATVRDLAQQRRRLVFDPQTGEPIGSEPTEG